MNSSLIEDKLQQKLFTLWTQGKLAHFYILQAPSTEIEPREFLKSWCNSFIAKTIAHQRGTSKELALETIEAGHGDLLYVTKESETQNYSIKEDTFDEFFRFQNFKNMELSQRFIVIDDAHSITKVLSNKLLKTLEEPAPNTTIFLLNPNRFEVLPTITSRAITLRIVGQNRVDTSTELNTFSKYLEQMSFEDGFITLIARYERDQQGLAEIIEYLKKNKEIERGLIDTLTQYIIYSKTDFQEVEKYLDAIKWYEQATTFNNYSAEKMTGILRHIR
ncbi:hypothetical protein [Halobacteriovorax sp. HLS]|uniref:hypothetical protein n=1 Tax=Halobacteriovorax sp. HLS TaxID=2234000 RepID=UPI000FD9AF3E|nr:hypothetical protein [Halobacteriovorax sp. HLS]